MEYYGLCRDGEKEKEPGRKQKRRQSIVRTTEEKTVSNKMWRKRNSMQKKLEKKERKMKNKEEEKMRKITEAKMRKEKKERKTRKTK